MYLPCNLAKCILVDHRENTSKLFCCFTFYCFSKEDIDIITLFLLEHITFTVIVVNPMLITIMFYISRTSKDSYVTQHQILNRGLLSQVKPYLELLVMSYIHIENCDKTFWVVKMCPQQCG